METQNIVIYDFALTRKHLADFDFRDNPITPNAANIVSAFTSNRTSAASERAVGASGTKPAYRISSRTWNGPNKKRTVVPCPL